MSNDDAQLSEDGTDNRSDSKEQEMLYTRRPERQISSDHELEMQVQQSEKQKLRCKTERQMEVWTKDMVVVDVVQMILNKILLGCTWITITGAPGEGKTTAAYLVLKQLHDQGKHIFDIRTPHEYDIIKTCPQRVILFNDMFGSSEFDLSRTKSWEPVLDDLLEMREHRGANRDRKYKQSHGQKKMHEKGHSHGTSVVTTEDPIIILVSRHYILNSASAHLGRYNDLILSNNNVFNMTTQYMLSDRDRKKIYKYHTKHLNLQPVFDATCNVTLHHGFPHCCRLFADMYSQNKDIKVELFFAKPLKFLNQTVKALCNDQIIGRLFKEMLMNDGILNLDTLSDDEKHFKWRQVALTLKDTYLDVKGGIVKFSHPSVYDSVAVVLSEIDPLFVITKCRLLLLKERVRFQKQMCEADPNSNVMVVLDDGYIKEFQQRLRKAITEHQYFLAISHSMCDDESFVDGLISPLVEHGSDTTKEEALRHLIHTPDVVCKRTFLLLSASSGSDKLLRYICGKIKLSLEEQKQILFGICEFAAVKPLLYFMTEFQDFNLDETRNVENQTPLMVAATTRNGNFLQRLLSKQTDVTAADSQNKTALDYLCEHGLDDARDIVQRFHEKGADISRRVGLYGHSPLHIACKKRHSGVVRGLVEIGADVQMRDKYGYTPFHLSCNTGQVGVVEAILACRGTNKVDVNEVDGAGSTPLHNASAADEEDIVKVLLDHGADVKRTDRYGDAALHKACRRGHIKIVKCLLDKGTNVNLKARAGITPLHCASGSGHVKVVKELLNRGADINSINIAKTSAVQLACFGGHGEVLKLLIKEKADMRRHTPTQLLDKACWRGHVEIINILLENGTNINLRNPIGHTPLQQAACRGHVDAVVSLIEKGADMAGTSPLGYTPIHCASYNGHPKAVETLIQKGADTIKQALDGESPLHKACFRGQTHVIPVLLSHGVDINLRSRKGDTPLHIASGEGHGTTVQFLLDKGATVNNTNKRSETPLHKACSGGHRNVAITLLDRGTDPNTVNQDGDTALHQSCRDGGIEAAAVLLERDVDINVQNKQCQTPLDLLCRLPWEKEGVLMLVKKLLDRGAY